MVMRACCLFALCLSGCTSQAVRVTFKHQALTNDATGNARVFSATDRIITDLSDLPKAPRTTARGSFAPRDRFRVYVRIPQSVVLQTFVARVQEYAMRYHGSEGLDGLHLSEIRVVSVHPSFWDCAHQ